MKVGDVVVDDEKRTDSLRISGHDRSNVRVYRVEHVNGEWLWLQHEKSGIAGWVQSKYVIPYEQAVDYYTGLIRSNPSASLYSSRGFVWNEKGEHDRAIADCNEAIRLEPGEAVYWSNCGNAWNAKKEYDKAIADYDEAIRLDPKNADVYGGRAWIWATCPDEKHRDGKRAVESATRACELSGWKDPYKLGNLAAAYAESGDFDKAVEWQEKAHALYSEGDKAKWGKLLALYRDKKPYRDAD